MARDNQSDESQPLTEQSLVFSASDSPSPKRARSSSSLSTTSLVLEHIQKPDHPRTPRTPAPDRYHDEENDSDAGHVREEMEEFDVEDGPLLQKGGRPVDARYRRWLWIVVVLCCVGWALALFLFIINGSYKHRSTVEHDPSSEKPIGAGSGKRISLDQLQVGTWRPRHKDISWIASPDGIDGLMLEKSYELDKPYLSVEDVRAWQDMATAQQPLVLMNKTAFDGPDGLVNPDEVWPSPDFKTVLIASERESNWRHSFTAKYYLFDVASQTAQPLDPAHPDDRVQLATWSPKSDMVVFTRDNNMYLRKVDVSDKNPNVTQITTDGGVEMFNGVPDWVYEEEVFADNSATWFSPTGKYVAFLATNETEVTEYPLQYFISRPSGKQPEPSLEYYPEEHRIKYPKAGSPNPTVHLRFYDVEKNAVFNVPIQDDFPDDDRLITEVIWAGDTSHVLIRQTNRESDILKLVLIDVEQKQGSIVRTQDVEKLDGGWFEISKTTTFIPADPANNRPSDGYIDTVIHNGYDHLAYFTPLNNSEPQMITTGNWEVVDAPSSVDLKKNLVYFTATKKSSIERHTYQVNLDGSGLLALTDESEEGYYDVKFSDGSGFALVSYEGPKIPYQKVFTTSSSNETFDHTLEENEELAALASAYELPVKVYSTLTIDGFELNVMERRPPHFDKNKQYPVLFWQYSGPGSQMVDKKFTVDFQSYAAATLGYIVVTLDGRGTGFLGRATRCIVRGDIGHWEAHDQIAAAQDWAARPYVDAARLAIWGWSYGGFATLKTLEADAGRTFRYGVAVAPVTDWRFYDTVYTERWMHTPQHNADGYAAAAVANVSALAQNTRFLVMHGTADDNVHVQNTLTLLDRLDLKGVTNYDVHVFPDSDHSIYFHNGNRVVYEKINWWLVNAFNGEWARIKDAKPLPKGQQVGAGAR